MHTHVYCRTTEHMELGEDQNKQEQRSVATGAAGLDADAPAVWWMRPPHRAPATGCKHSDGHACMCWSSCTQRTASRARPCAAGIRFQTNTDCSSSFHWQGFPPSLWLKLFLLVASVKFNSNYLTRPWGAIQGRHKNTQIMWCGVLLKSCDLWWSKILLMYTKALQSQGPVVVANVTLLKKVYIYQKVMVNLP